MGNMSYCRFENTYRDLLDCSRNMFNIESKSEHDYMIRLVDVCRDIIDTYEMNKLGEWDGEDEYDIREIEDDTQDNNDEVPWDTQTK